MRGALLIGLGFALLSACEDAETPGGGGDPGCPLAVVASDYASTTVSLLDARGELCVPDLLHSGSRRPALVTALSGDVVLPSAPHPVGLLTLIDRYPNSVLTFVDATSGGVVAQLSVGTGFASNPQDVAFVGADKAYVSRLESNPTPTPELGDHDEGGDLLVLDTRDPSAPAIAGRVDLSELTELDPRPGALLVQGGLVWVGLGNLSRAFDEGGPGLVVAIDAATDAVVHTLALTELANCGRDLAADPGGDGFWLVCAGVYADGEAAQIDASALAFVRTGDSPAAEVVVSARDVGRPIVGGLAPTGPGEVAFVAQGELAGPTPDALWSVRRGELPKPLNVESGPFEMGGALLAEGLLLVPDADPEAPVLLRRTLSGQALVPVVVSQETGLPPRQIARFRP